MGILILYVGYIAYKLIYISILDQLSSLFWNWRCLKGAEIAGFE